MKTDIIYFHEGFFTVFYPESDSGVTAIKELMLKNEGNTKVFRSSHKSTVEQIRAAGYIVQYKKPEKTTNEEADYLLAELL